MNKLRLVVWIKVLVMVFAGWSASSHAAVIGTAEYMEGAQLSSADAAQLRESVQQQLVSLGVTDEHALERVASLSQEQLQLLAEKIDELPAGSGALSTLGVVFLVLLVLELLGVTNVFTAI